MRCADCRHFNHKYTSPVRDEKTGQITQMKSGMCRAWGFSVNEKDGRTCQKSEPKEVDECERAD